MKWLLIVFVAVAAIYGFAAINMRMAARNLVAWSDNSCARSGGFLSFLKLKGKKGSAQNDWSLICIYPEMNFFEVCAYLLEIR